MSICGSSRGSASFWRGRKVRGGAVSLNVSLDAQAICLRFRSVSLNVSLRLERWVVDFRETGFELGRPSVRDKKKDKKNNKKKDLRFFG